MASQAQAEIFLAHNVCLNLDNVPIDAKATGKTSEHQHVLLRVTNEKAPDGLQAPSFTFNAVELGNAAPNPAQSSTGEPSHKKMIWWGMWHPEAHGYGATGKGKKPSAKATPAQRSFMLQHTGTGAASQPFKEFLNSTQCGKLEFATGFPIESMFMVFHDPTSESNRAWIRAQPDAANDGLYEACYVPKDEVFAFPAYRNDEVKGKDAQKAQRIKLLKALKFDSSDPTVIKQTIAKQDHAILNIENIRDVLFQFRMLASADVSSLSYKYLTEVLMPLLERRASRVAAKLNPTTAISAMFYDRAQMDAAQAEAFRAELKLVYPLLDLDDSDMELSVRSIMDLSQAMKLAATGSPPRRVLPCGIRAIFLTFWGKEYHATMLRKQMEAPSSSNADTSMSGTTDDHDDADHVHQRNLMRMYTTAARHAYMHDMPQANDILPLHNDASAAMLLDHKQFLEFFLEIHDNVTQTATAQAGPWTGERMSNAELAAKFLDEPGPIELASYFAAAERNAVLHIDSHFRLGRTMLREKIQQLEDALIFLAGASN